MPDKNPTPNQSEQASSADFCSNLLQRMTLDEKIGQMVQIDLTFRHDIRQFLREGRIGSVFSIIDPDLINEFQHIAMEESRLKIPLLIGNDVIHGFRTIFPIPLALASAWDDNLVEQTASAISREAMAAGTFLNFAPMVDICRDPRWGRIAEGAGEDPVLGSRMARAWVRGIQTPIDDQGRFTAACVKHYAAYGGAESGKDYNSVDMSERRLREEYLPPYQAAVQAGVMTLMTAFNDLNGIPASANPFLLRQILREEWRFEGAVMSDYDAIAELVAHGFAKDIKEAALKSALAGVDMDMMGYAYQNHLAELVKEGAIAEEIIDNAVFRLLKLKKDLGLFEAPFIESTQTGTFLQQKPALDLARRAAEESIVLLKNDDNLLPLYPHGKTIALIGPFAEERRSLLGCWHCTGRAEDVQTLRETLELSLPEDTRLLVETGCQIDGQESDFSAALNAALQADIILLALGESDAMSGEAHSRAHLGLPGQQQPLLDALAAVGKPLVLLLFTGRPLAIPVAADKVSALLCAWHGGTRAAQAVVNALLGKTNPSGKLPVSFPRSEGQIPVYYGHKNTGRPAASRGVTQFLDPYKSTYLDESNQALFPFGYGLSYTQFEYTNLAVKKTVLQANETLEVSADITNTGRLKGAEIVQLYVQDMVGCVTRPVKQLKDFKKITLDAGESAQADFKLPVAELAFLDENLQPVIEPGDFKVWIAPHSQSGLEGQFEVI